MVATTPPKWQQRKDTWLACWTGIKGQHYRDPSSTTCKRCWCHNLHPYRVAATVRLTVHIHNITNFLDQEACRNTAIKSHGVFYEERYTVSKNVIVGSSTAQGHILSVFLFISVYVRTENILAWQFLNETYVKLAMIIRTIITEQWLHYSMCAPPPRSWVGLWWVRVVSCRVVEL
jgi:hypothetical protein